MTSKLKIVSLEPTDDDQSKQPEFKPPSKGLSYREWKARVDLGFVACKSTRRKSLFGRIKDQGTNFLMRRRLEQARIDDERINRNQK